MSLSTLAVCCVVGLISHPFNSFTILAWNQPASFLATFVRRRIENVGQFFQKELPEQDAFNTRQYYWFYASLRAYGVGMLYRGILTWTATGAFSLTPFIPRFIQTGFRFIKEKISQKLLGNNNKNNNTTIDDTMVVSTSSSLEMAREEILLKTEADRILGYTLNFSTASLVRSTFRAILSGTVSILTSPLQVVLTIFVADISNGYPTLERAWKGFKASTLCDWDRDNPPYKPGMDPWVRHRPRPSLPYLIYWKFSKARILTEAILPFTKYAVAHSLVSSLVQWFESYLQRRRFLQTLNEGDEDASYENNINKKERILEKLAQDHLGSYFSTLIFQTHLTAFQKFKKVIVNSGHFVRVFVVAATLHGLVSYNMSQELSTAVQNLCKMTDYAQPYQAAGGMASVSNPLILRVPKISLFFAVSDGVCWGLITSLVASWR